MREFHPHIYLSQMFRLKSSVVIAHITGWLICLGLPLLFISGQTGDSKALSILFSTDYLVFLVTYVALFYFHTTFLFPRLYFRKLHVLYFLSVFLLLVMVNHMRPYDHLFSKLPHPAREEQWQPQPPPGEIPRGPEGMEPPHRPPMRIDIVSDFLFLLTIALSIAIETTHRWRQTEKRALYAETRKTQAELSFLKAQINPHFLFNTLNNIYSLAITRSDHTAMSIMKLSNMLRYVTEDTRDDYVLLESEIDCLRDYIDLQKLRLTTKTKVNFAVTGSPGIKCIAPLVLLPFLENAFKYGVSNHEPSEITILLQTTENKIHFYCSNKLFRISPDTNRTGIGISNTRQRLDHLYPDKYELQISEDNGAYAISLQLQV
ncbi:sensor histidine kinase [Chitinophaga arvensicola]|uniref:Histidine kinase n=1 Tax=Chitinophaga arvensicola TaxID=29529 RepID=A0A1I0SAQ5_9BACT|nr:sensor histidine kinase [Chitinophaga arvensicola]SEW53645.1 Histidine kinase [Chitinophaga arvensicola]